MRLHDTQSREFDAVAYRHHFGGDRNTATPHESLSVPPIVSDVLRSSGHPLDLSTRAFMEDRFGHDFSKVRVHSDPFAAHSARAVNAHAYTVGSQIVFGAGNYNQSSNEGRRLLAHELAHVVQQDRSGAAPSASKLQRAPIDEDELHKPMIEEYRRQHGLPPGGVDESGKRVGPSDAEIQYFLLPVASGIVPARPYCPTVEVLEGESDFSDEQFQAYLDAECYTPASKAMRPFCEFTPEQTKILEEAQKTAFGRVERALALINMSDEGKKMATDMAVQLFESDPPTLVEVVERLTKVHDFLKTAKVDFAGITCGHPSCQDGAVAGVTGKGALPIYVCPTAFTMPSTLYRPVLHESLHWSGLDANPKTPEGYCLQFDCKTPCLNKEVADAWAHYIDCLGKPLEIRPADSEKK